MTTIYVPPRFPSPIPEKRFARNDSLPSTSAFRRAATSLAYTARHQRKHLFSYSWPTQTTPLGALALSGKEIFLFRTGENVQEVVFWIGMVPSDVSYATAAPAVYVELSDGTSDINSDTVSNGITNTSGGTYTPDQVTWHRIKITKSDGLLDDTVYRATIYRQYYARIHSVMAHEVGALPDTANTGIPNVLAFEEQDPIYDSDQQALLEAADALYKHNGAQLISWSMPNGTAQTTNSTTWKNLVSGATTGFSSTSAGWVVNTQYHDSLAADIPVCLAVYASCSPAPAATLSIRLVNSGGTLLSATGIADGTSNVDPCYVITGTIPAAASDKMDIEISTNGGAGTFSVYAVSLYEYEA